MKPRTLARKVAVKVSKAVADSARHAMAWDAYYAKEALLMLDESAPGTQVEVLVFGGGMGVRLQRAAAMVRLCWTSKTVSGLSTPRVHWTLVSAQTNEPVGTASALAPLEAKAVWAHGGKTHRVKTGSLGARKALLRHVLNQIVKENEHASA